MSSMIFHSITSSTTLYGNQADAAGETMCKDVCVALLLAVIRNISHDSTYLQRIARE